MPHRTNSSGDTVFTDTLSPSQGGSSGSSSLDVSSTSESTPQPTVADALSFPRDQYGELMIQVPDQPQLRPGEYDADEKSLCILLKMDDISPLVLSFLSVVELMFLQQVSHNSIVSHSITALINQSDQRNKYVVAHTV